MANDTRITQTHTVRISKLYDRQPTIDKMAKQIQTILDGVSTAQRTKLGWDIHVPNFPDGKGWYRQEFDYSKRGSTASTCHVTFEVELITDRARPTFDAEFSNIVTSIAAKSVYPKWGVTEVDSLPYVVTSGDVAPEEMGEVEAIGYSPFFLPEWSVFRSHFDHLYGLDDHIRRIYDALQAAVRSNWRHRFHCVLIGPPGCGKSDLVESLKNAIGEDSVLSYDGTSTTMVGAQKDLEKREELPRVLSVEEIEKAPTDSTQWLLSLMDLRSEVRRLTARSSILRDTKMICIATANDEDLLKKASAGALYSRFSSNKIYFQRPTRELLAKILTREVDSVNGNRLWIEPALDYAEAIDTTDPREVIAICLCGGDDLLTGEYQRRMLNTGLPHKDGTDSLVDSLANVKRLVQRFDTGEEDAA